VTPADLKEHVWRKLGARKWLLGREQVDLLTQLTVENWQTDYYNAAATAADRQVVASGTLVAVKRMHQLVGGYSEREYGMIWAFLLSAVASAVIQVVLKWWLERRSNRVMLLVWQQEGMQ
jgi:peptidyl-tRNA hydrolase